MPKNIENLKENILKSAEELLLKDGLKAFTLRAVAKKCGIAVGTIYNYFPSKDMIIANIMLKDWLYIIDEIKLLCEKSNSLSEAVMGAYIKIEGFTKKYISIWAEYSAPMAFKKENNRHQMLIEQLADCFILLCERENKYKTREERCFLAENIFVCLNGGTVSIESFIKIII